MGSDICVEKRKVAVVQGGTAGIGLSAARRLIADGFSVLVCSRRQSNVDAALKSLDSPFAHGIAGHAGDADGRRCLADAASALRSDGLVHALVCNVAASTFYGPILDTSEEQFSKMLHINVLASFLTIQEFYRRKMLAPGCSIVLTASIGAFQALPGLGAYSVTKTALLGLCKVLAAELSLPPARIRVNCVAPGIIRTKFSSSLWKPFEHYGDEATTKMRLGDLLGRLGEPRDIAGVISFLVSEDSAYVTGECIVSSGGMLSRL